MGRDRRRPILGDKAFLPTAAVMFRKDRRIPARYFVIIRNGEDWREFDDMKLMCELMGLDEGITNRHFEEKGYYVGYEFTVFRVYPESKTSHRGHFY